MKTIVKIEPEWNNSHAWLSDVDYVLPNWIEVPESLLSTWEELKPFVNLNISDEGVLIGITKAEEIQPEPLPEVSDPIEELDAMVVDHEYRLVLVELGLNTETEV